MALLTCKDCKNQVSTDAKACPQCGAKVEKPHSIGQWIFIGLATAWIVSCVAKGESEKELVARQQAEREAKKTPEQKEADRLAKVKTEAEFQLVVLGAKRLKQMVKNPDSFKLGSVIYTDGGAICYEYHATNSFNAVVPGVFVIAKNTASQQAADWNKFCGGKSGTNYSHAKYAL